MARPLKTGLDYFPMDINFFSDLKIRKLIKYQSGKATAVYTLLLCNIYEAGYYIKWDNELPFTISEKTGFEEGYVSEVIACCIKVGLFSKSLFDQHQVLTSQGIQKRYELICQQLKRKVNISEYKAVNTEETDVLTEETPDNSESIQQRKGKEIKGNEKKGNDAPAFNKFEYSNSVPLPPSQADCEYFFEQLGQKKELGAKFFNEYSITGWMYKGSQITNWTSLARKWILNEKTYNNGKSNGRDIRKEPNPHGTPQGKL